AAVCALYFIVRIIGKYFGSTLGCVLTKSGKKESFLFGLALIPQAGVAIGLAFMGGKILGGEYGNALQTIILASSVLYEMVGPACAKLALYLSKSYSDKIEEVAPVEKAERLSEVEILIERIQKIQREINPSDQRADEAEERAFTEAAEDQIDAYYLPPRRHNGRGIINK
ncbi:MAG: hypothetical protein MJ072_05575, partial [Clostridia bacterium]|nr:hypothetical protein [Clostridia bacterium]